MLSQPAAREPGESLIPDTGYARKSFRGGCDEGPRCLFQARKRTGLRERHRGSEPQSFSLIRSVTGRAGRARAAAGHPEGWIQAAARGRRSSKGYGQACVRQRAGHVATFHRKDLKRKGMDGSGRSSRSVTRQAQSRGPHARQHRQAPLQSQNARVHTVWKEGRPSLCRFAEVRCGECGTCRSSRRENRQNHARTAKVRLMITRAPTTGPSRFNIAILMPQTTRNRDEAPW